MVYTLDLICGLDIYVDADFAGGWNSTQADDANNVYSHTSFVICHAGCLVYWQSKLLTEIALSTVKAEYVAMSQALRETTLSDL